MASNGYPQQGETDHATTSSGGQTTSQQPDQVGWYFVEQYYTTLNNNPEHVGLFYGKKSSLVWGNEGEVLPMIQGRHDISERIKSLNFKDCKVRITNVDSQASDGTGILIQVMGEMSNDNCPRRFVQTFFLAAQPNGYYVLNDILRYLKEDEEIPSHYDDEVIDGTLSGGQYIDEKLPQTTTEEATVSVPDPTPVEEIPAEEPIKDSEEPNVPAEEPIKDSEEQSVPAEPEPEPVPIKIEEPITIAPAVPEISVVVPSSIEIINGTPDVEEADLEVPAEESETVPEVVEEAVSAPSAPITESISVTPPQPSPVATPPRQPAVVEKPQAPVAPQRPATWASLLGSSGSAKTPIPPSVSPSAPASQTTSASQQTQGTQPTPTTPLTTPTSPPGGQWRNVPDNSKRHVRNNLVSGAGDLQAQAYIKSVTENVDIDSLKAALSKFGPIKAFEHIRQKGYAIVEFESVASAKTARSSSPLSIGGQLIQLDERRPPGKGPGGYPPNRSHSTGQRVGETRQGQGQGRSPFPRADGRFDGRDGRDGGRSGPRGGSGRPFVPRRGGTTATN